MNHIFTITIFLSSLLIFLVQPMLGKLMLPFVGGAPAAWNTSMLFFQVLLLGGYAYVHFFRKVITVKYHAYTHLALLLLACALYIPLQFNLPTGTDPALQPVPWLLLALLGTIGLPFFLLSANATLIQYLYANTSLKNAGNPYFLYTASNAGSFIGLFAYPLYIEYGFDSGAQLELWSGLYLVLIALLGLCTLQMHRHFKPLPKIETIDAEDTPAVSAKTRLHWMFLAFVPTTVMLGATTHITQETGSIPLIWIIPLAIYLLSFVFVFREKMIAYDRCMVAHVTLLLATFFILFTKLDMVFTSAMLIHFFLLYAVCIVCHGQLYLSRPLPQRLPEFYLYMSLGGALGGFFSAILAPAFFESAAEYPLMLLLSLAARPGFKLRFPQLQKKQMALLGLFLLTVILFAVVNPADFEDSTIVSSTLVFQLKLAVLLVVIAITIVKFLEIPLVLMVIFGTYFLLYHESVREGGNVMLLERNFFGISMVGKVNDTHIYVNGNTVHGLQVWDEDGPQARLTSYYYTLQHLNLNNKTSRIGVAGLGAGTLGCMRPEEKYHFDFYEINPLVKAIAEHPDYFTFLRDCPDSYDVLLGDARLELTKKPAGLYDMLILDVFSSDAIPLHLMTTEAFQIYARLIHEKGIIGVHISNRHLDFAPIVADIAKAVGLKGALYIFDPKKSNIDMVKNSHIGASKWIFLSKNDEDIVLDVENIEVRPLPYSDNAAWTDQRSNVIEPIFYGLSSD